MLYRNKYSEEVANILDPVRVSEEGIEEILSFMSRAGVGCEVFLLEDHDGSASNAGKPCLKIESKLNVAYAYENDLFVVFSESRFHTLSRDKFKESFVVVESNDIEKEKMLSRPCFEDLQSILSDIAESLGTIARNTTQY